MEFGETKRNTVNKTGKVDTIDRWTKKRLIIIDSCLLLNQSTQDWCFLWIDTAELSDYHDVIITCKNKEEIDYVEKFLEHWGLTAEAVVERFQDIKEMRKKYRILLAMANDADREDYTKNYKCPFLGR